MQKNGECGGTCLKFACVVAQNSRKIHEEIFGWNFASFARAVLKWLLLLRLRSRLVWVCNGKGLHEPFFARD